MKRMDRSLSKYSSFGPHINIFEFERNPCIASTKKVHFTISQSFDIFIFLTQEKPLTINYLHINIFQCNIFHFLLNTCDTVLKLSVCIKSLKSARKRVLYHLLFPIHSKIEFFSMFHPYITIHVFSFANRGILIYFINICMTYVRDFIHMLSQMKIYILHTYILHTLECTYMI